jgi:hypothetical protein
MARGEYGNVHRVVLQTFMSKKVIVEKEALELVRASARYKADTLAHARLHVSCL